VEGDGLETDEIVAIRDGCGNGGRPRAVLRDHLAISPRTAVDGAGEETGLVDLEPFEAVRVDTSAGATAVGEVGQHRADRMGPDLVPECGDGGSSCDRCSELESAGGAVIVASNRGGCSIGDRVVGRPGALNCRLTSRAVIRRPSRVPGFGPAVRQDTAVGGDLRDSGASENSKSCEGEHFVSFCSPSFNSNGELELRNKTCPPNVGLYIPFKFTLGK